MVARSELRRRWRSAVLITLTVVLVGVVVLATVAGARRSTTALARFSASSRASDLELDVDAATPPGQVDAFAHSPGVAAVARLYAYAQQVDGYPELQIASALDGRLGSVVDRARVVSGRMTNPDAPFEIDVGEGLAKLAHLHVGDHVHTSSLSPAQMALLESGKEPGPAKGPSSTLNVVGVVRRPLDLGDRAASGGVVILTPAYNRQFHDRIGVFTEVLRVRLVDGKRDVPRVEATARRLFGKSPFFQATDLSVENGGASDAINVLTLALWIFAAVGALAGAVAISIVLAREVSVSGVDQPTLQSLGMTPRARFAAGALLSAFVAGAGVLVAAILAVCVSPLFPVGIARRADPHPGLHVDWLAIGGGAAVLAVFVVVVGSLAAFRVSRASALAHPRRARQLGAAWSERTSRAGFSPSFTNGFRMAFEPGSGERAVPVRSAFVGAIFGVLGVTAVVVFAASLTHLAATPRLYGWTFGFKAPDDTFRNSCQTSDDVGVGKVAGVGDVAAVCFAPITVDGRAATGWGVRPIRGTIDFEVLAGRMPRTSSEVDLGTTTLAALHKKIGDLVQASAAHGPTQYRIVGRAVFPRLYGQDIQPLADGVLFTGAGFRPLETDNSNVSRYLLGRFASGADHAQVLARVSKLPDVNPTPGATTLTSDRGAHAATVPPEIERLRHIGWFAPTLGALLTLLASLAVGHAVVTSVRRRRREFATLKTLGFLRRQVRTTIAWQATMLAGVGVVVGLPLGILLGRVTWRLLAESLGVSTTAWISVAAPVVVALLAVAIINLISVVPARSAASTRPAVALRTE